jgi:hypothetical protein
MADYSHWGWMAAAELPPSADGDVLLKRVEIMANAVKQTTLELDAAEKAAGGAQRPGFSVAYDLARVAKATAMAHYQEAIKALIMQRLGLTDEDPQQSFPIRGL